MDQRTANRDSLGPDLHAGFGAVVDGSLELARQEIAVCLVNTCDRAIVLNPDQQHATICVCQTHDCLEQFRVVDRTVTFELEGH